MREVWQGTRESHPWRSILSGKVGVEKITQRKGCFVLSLETHTHTHTQNQSKLNNSLITGSQYHSPERLRKNSQKSIDPCVVFSFQPPSLEELLKYLAKDLETDLWTRGNHASEWLRMPTMQRLAGTDPGIPAGWCFISGTACHPFGSQASSFEPPQVCWSHWVVPCCGEASLQGWKPGKEWEEAWVLAGLLSTSANSAGLETRVSGLLSPSWKPPALDNLSDPG